MFIVRRREDGFYLGKNHQWVEDINQSRIFKRRSDAKLARGTSMWRIVRPEPHPPYPTAFNVRPAERRTKAENEAIDFYYAECARIKLDYQNRKRNTWMNLYEIIEISLSVKEKV